MINKKGNLDLLGSVVVAFIVAGITLTLGSKVLIDTQNVLGGNSTVGYQTPQWLVVQNTSDAIGNIATNLPLLGTIAALVIVIGFVIVLKYGSDGA